MGELNAGRKQLRPFLKDDPEAMQRDQALFGLLVADFRQGKRADAEKTPAEMKEQYPTSEETAAAGRLVAAAKGPVKD